MPITTLCVYKWRTEFQSMSLVVSLIHELSHFSFDFLTFNQKQTTNSLTMSKKFSLDIIPNDILMLILRKLDFRTLVSTVPLICRRLSTMCISSIDDKDLNSSLFCARKIVNKFSKEIQVPEQLSVDVLTSTFENSFEPGDIYSIRISSNDEKHTGLETYITEFFALFQTQTFISLKSVLLYNMRMTSEIVTSVSCHELEYLHLKCCYHYYMALEKILSGKELRFTSCSGNFCMSSLPPNLERLIVQTPVHNEDNFSQGISVNAINCGNLTYT